MSRRPISLLVITLVAVTLSACADSTTPTLAPPTARQIQPAGQASQDVGDPDVCRGGYVTSTGKAC